jgi:hypothetical protein
VIHADSKFIDKTITFLTQRIREQFPRIPIYPALGNADSYCGDYQLQPKGEFLRRTADTRKDYFATATMSKLSCKPSRPADTMRLLHPGRPKLALRLQEGKVPGWTAHAVAAGAVSERNPAKNPIKKVNRIVIVQYSDVSRI